MTRNNNYGEKQKHWTKIYIYFGGVHSSLIVRDTCALRFTFVFVYRYFLWFANAVYALECLPLKQHAAVTHQNSFKCSG